MIHHVGEVLSHRKLSDEYHLLSIVAPEIAEQARPGQFVNIRPQSDRSLILRRPFSIFRANRRGGYAATIEIVFDVRGSGTLSLSHLRPHDAIDVLGPIGKPFTMPVKQNSCLLVGGGVGAVPLFFLGEELRALGKRVDVLWGASTSSRLVSPIDAKRLGTVTAFATDDGSEGHRGLLTDLLPGLLRRCETEVVYACGPHAMLAAVSRIALQNDVPVQVAVEELMGCGIGVCMTCIQSVWSRDGKRVQHLRTCVDGPVFNGARVAWDTSPATPTPTPVGN